jgi:hypothetical protein
MMSTNFERAANTEAGAEATVKRQVRYTQREREEEGSRAQSAEREGRGREQGESRERQWERTERADTRQAD